MTSTDPTTLPTIDVYADIWCPFTHVGLVRLVARRNEDPVIHRFRVHPWPLEIVNGQPLDPRHVAAEIDALREEIAPDLFLGFDADHFPRSTLEALALVEAAYRIGLEVGEAASLGVRAALFEQGRDVGAPAVLGELATELGLPSPEERDRRAVEASLHAGRAGGVVGSPHFFTPHGDFFCPTLDIRRVDGRFLITEDREAADRLAEACFGS